MRQHLFDGVSGGRPQIGAPFGPGCGSCASALGRRPAPGSAGRAVLPNHRFAYSSVPVFRLARPQRTAGGRRPRTPPSLSLSRASARGAPLETVLVLRGGGGAPASRQACRATPVLRCSSVYPLALPRCASDPDPYDWAARLRLAAAVQGHLPGTVRDTRRILAVDRAKTFVAGQCSGLPRLHGAEPRTGEHHAAPSHPPETVSFDHLRTRTTRSL